jgi:MFS family permease
MIRKPLEWQPTQRLVIALCFGVNMLDGMDVLVLSYLAPTLQRQWLIDSASFGAAFSAGLAGMAIGGLIVAPQADRWGRRPVLLAALVVMALGMLASGTAAGLKELVALRVIVGCGIGTALACIAALAAEHSPLKDRDFAVGVLQAGYPIGATITGYVVAWALPSFGWRRILLGTGLLTMAFVPVLGLLLPESLPPTHTAPDAAAVRAREASLAALFQPHRRLKLLLLCGASISGFMVLYFIISWITTLALAAGLAESNAIVAGAVYNLGAFAGTLGMSVIATRIDVRRLIACLLMSAAVVMLAFGGIHMPVLPLLATAFLLGATLQGGFNGLYPLIAGAYPAEIRASAVGWSIGLGRIGAFSGPLLGGWVLGAGWSLIAVFAGFCAPLLVASGCALAVPRSEELRSHA